MLLEPAAERDSKKHPTWAELAKKGMQGYQVNCPGCEAKSKSKSKSSSN